MDKSFPQRKNPRLQEYDYAQEGMYFVTICTHQRIYYFGHIQEDTMQLNAMGVIAHQEITNIRTYWESVEVDSFIVMPNHVHLIVTFNHAVGTAFLPSAAQPETDTQKHVPALAHVIGNYKAGVTRRIRLELAHSKFKVWQTRFHDHIIRNETSLNQIRQYVSQNPALWEKDRLK